MLSGEFHPGRNSSVLHAKICATCGARNVRNRWVDNGSLEDVVIRTAEDALYVHDMAEDIEIYVEPKALTPYLYKVHIEVDAMLLDEMFHQDLDTEIRVIRESCDSAAVFQVATLKLSYK
ncbi:MAG: NMD3-related protein [Methanolobus sp.]